MGNDIILRDRSTDLAKSFQSMVQAPLDYLIATLRTLQSMVSAKVNSGHAHFLGGYRSRVLEL